MDKSDVKVYIGVSAYDRPEWGAEIKLQQTIQYCRSHGITTKLRPRVGDGLVSRSRNNVLADYLETDYDYLFTWDDDLEIPEYTIAKLVENDRDICGGFYRLKTDEAPRVAVRLRQDFKEDYSDVLKRSMILPVKYVSTGCMMIRRNVIRKMIDEYPELYYKENVTGKDRWGLFIPYIHNLEYLSEDWAFCQRAQDIGFEVWADGGIKCHHWGKKLYKLGED